MSSLSTLPRPRRRPTLIGLLGKKRSGKDTFASALIEEHGFTRVAFADPLKKTMIELDPWIPIESSAYIRKGEQYIARLSALVGPDGIGWESAKEIPEVRRLLQAHGVAIREYVGADVWVDAAFLAITKIQEDRSAWLRDRLTPVVITDVRFPNEAERVKREGGKLIRIVRPDLVSTDTHVSETLLDDYPVDLAVSNEGTIEELQENASLALARLSE